MIPALTSPYSPELVGAEVSSEDRQEGTKYRSLVDVPSLLSRVYCPTIVAGAAGFPYFVRPLKEVGQR